jgi:hypothetical protein
MQIKRKNVARLASLSALGAGALGVTAGTAQATDIIVYTPSSPVLVGFGPGPGGTLSIYHAAVGSKAFSVLASFRKASTNAGVSTWRVDVGGGVAFQANTIHSKFLDIVGPGAEWGGHLALGLLHVATRGSTHVGGYNGTSQYALFTFEDASFNNYYGWLQLDSAVSGSAGPLITLNEWAYDDTPGEFIAAGDTGVPEPSTMDLTGLAALILGAAGLRRWRAARKPAA